MADDSDVGTEPDVARIAGDWGGVHTKDTISAVDFGTGSRLIQMATTRYQRTSSTPLREWLKKSKTSQAELENLSNTIF